MTRPKHTKPDEVQNEQNARLREWGCRCIVTSDLPGKRHKGEATENPLDTLVLSPCTRFLLLVEWKNGLDDDFTPNEIEFFGSLGLWPPILPAVESWRRTRVPIVVAWRAEQIMDVFVAMEESNYAKTN